MHLKQDASTTEKRIVSALEATDKDFEQMMQMLTGFWVTQIAGAVATYSIADHLAKGPATAEEISKMAGIDSIAGFRLLRACGSLGLVTFDGVTFSATPLLVTLRTEVPGSLRSYAISKALGADFFTSVPEADIYLLKQVLHDWNDKEAVRILQRCPEAMRSGGRVIVIEMLLGEIGEPGFAPLMDLNMMVMQTGRERTLAEYESLLEAADLRLSKSTPIRSPMSIIEAVAA